MKKVLFILFLAGAIAIGLGASSSQRIDSWRTLDSIADVNATPDTDLAAASGFFPAAISGEFDLVNIFGAGRDTYAKYVQIILHIEDGADNDTVTQVLYGRAEGGPPQRIASIVWKIGAAQYDATATNLWAETATVTSDHASVITVLGDDTDDMVGAVIFDATNYRFIKSYFTAETGNPTACYALIRPLN